MITVSLEEPRVRTEKYRQGDSKQSGSLKFISCPFRVQRMSAEPLCSERLDRQRLKRRLIIYKSNQCQNSTNIILQTAPTHRTSRRCQLSATRAALSTSESCSFLRLREGKQRRAEGPRVLDVRPEELSPLYTRQSHFYFSNSVTYNLAGFWQNSRFDFHVLLPDRRRVSPADKRHVSLRSAAVLEISVMSNTCQESATSVCLKSL